MESKGLEKIHNQTSVPEGTDCSARSSRVEHGCMLRQETQTLSPAFRTACGAHLLGSHGQAARARYGGLGRCLPQHSTGAFGPCWIVTISLRS
eukprot:scaffold2808_cov255-Pinguiococcus_pyrenoidosus.AAC.33